MTSADLRSRPHATGLIEPAEVQSHSRVSPSGFDATAYCLLTVLRDRAETDTAVGRGVSAELSGGQ